MSSPAATLHYPIEHAPAAGSTVEVAPGVRWLRMPLPFALDHINLWLIEDGEGWTAVDSGIDREEVRQHWETIFGHHLDGRPIRRLVVTHFHPDHLGLAHWLCASLDIPVFMTQGEYLTAWAVSEDIGSYSGATMRALFRRHGLAEDRIEALERRGNAYKRGVPALPARYERLIDGDELAIGGRSWRVMVGYGHAPEHAALYCASLGVLISGDMVLPRISTNVNVSTASPGGDSLGLFLASLRRYAGLPEDTLVLPSHGRPFRGLQARVEQLAAHHAERCDALLAACGEPLSAWELVPTLFPRELDTHQVMFAMGEAIAHLNHLEHDRRIRRVGEGELIRYVRIH